MTAALLRAVTEYDLVLIEQILDKMEEAALIACDEKRAARITPARIAELVDKVRELIEATRTAQNLPEEVDY